MAAAANRGLVHYLKNKWHESPEIVGSAVLGAFGVCLAVYANIVYYKNDGDNRKYKQFYTVYRHDDPRVQKLKTQCDTTGQ